MILETESALQKAMRDEGVPECNWLHSNGSKMFKIDLSGVFVETKKLFKTKETKNESNSKQ